MSWAKIDDQLHGHPKLAKLGTLMLPCLGLYTLSLSWTAAYLTEGVISLDQANRLAGIESKSLMDKLVSSGLLDVVDVATYRIHDYLDYNPSRRHALKVKKIRALAGSKGGKQKSSNLLEAGKALATDSVKQNSTPSPSPSLKEKKKTLAHPDAREGFDTFWKSYPKKKSKGDAEKAWKVLKPNKDLLSTILAAIDRAKVSDDWTKGGGQYIPHPATWLRAKGWEDEEAAPPMAASNNPLGLYADWPSPPAEDFCVHGWGLTPELREKHGDRPDVECGGCQRDREKAAAPP